MKLASNKLDTQNTYERNINLDMETKHKAHFETAFVLPGTQHFLLCDVAFPDCVRSSVFIIDNHYPLSVIPSVHVIIVLSGSLAFIKQTRLIRRLALTVIGSSCNLHPADHYREIDARNRTRPSSLSCSIGANQYDRY